MPSLSVEPGEIVRLVGVDGKSETQRPQAPCRQRLELTQRVSLLSVERASVGNRTVASPVSNRRERFVWLTLADWPFVQHNGLPGRNPRATACGNARGGAANGETDGAEMRMTVESGIDARGMPELIEPRVEIQIEARGNALHQCRVGQHPGDVDEQISAAGDRPQGLVRTADCFGRILQKQCGSR